MNSYIKEVYDHLVERAPEEREFHQAAKEVLDSLEKVVSENETEYRRVALLERLVEPERTIIFKVPWEDDNGQMHVNKGYRIQFNGSIGPYKGGLRFNPTVRLGLLKFLGFEQIFKNSLTGLPIGGAKGGSDFDPSYKSDSEIKRFCKSFMTELYRHIGPYIDVPAGDLGVTGKEIGFLYGQYRRIKGMSESGVITGKPISIGGSLIRPEATGYGLSYFLKEILDDNNIDIIGKKVAISGYGNVAWGAALKMKELGAKVVTLSSSKGYIYVEEGLTKEMIDYMLVVRADSNQNLKDLADKFNLKFRIAGKPWEIPVDFALPCATQNELDFEDAKKLVNNGVIAVCEGANMPCTPDAIHHFEKNNVKYGCGKAANAGGVAISALEMSQNSIRYSWTAETVDNKLVDIMKHIYSSSKEMSLKYNVTLSQGANIAGFLKVANAMLVQGDY
ncbi:MAG: NADP-specific glutamate dehydrogenase [Fusobacterium sp. JB021]|nr:NADP-specific glutamate dehydrogenase [Fusobacterium sp. JB021]